MIKQRKLKYKKSFNKSFHKNIHEFAVADLKKNIKTVLETLTGIAIALLVKSCAFPDTFIRRCFYKNVKNLQNS